MFPRPVAAAGRFAESKLMPWAHRGICSSRCPTRRRRAARDRCRRERIRQICNGVVQPDPPTPRSPEPLFLALGRLTEYKRIDLLLRLWDRVRPVVGGKLVIAGDGPERARLQAWRAGTSFCWARIGAGEAPAAVLSLAVAASGAHRGLGHRHCRSRYPRYRGDRIRRARPARLCRQRRDRRPGQERGPVRLGMGGSRARSWAPSDMGELAQAGPSGCTGRLPWTDSPRWPTRQSQG